MPKARKTRDCDSSMTEMSGEPAKRRKTDSPGVKISMSIIESELKSSSQRPKTRSTDPGPSSKEKYENRCDSASDLEGTWLSSEAPESSSQKIPEPVVKLEAKNETDFVSDEKEFEFSACVADEKRTLREQTESESSVKERSGLDFLDGNERKETAGNQAKEDGKESMKAFNFLNNRGIIRSAPVNVPQRQHSSENQEKNDRPTTKTTDPGPSSKEKYEPSCDFVVDLEFKQGSFDAPETSSQLEAKNVAEFELEQKEFEYSACAASEVTIVAEQTTIESSERERRDVVFLDENKPKVTCESRVKVEGEEETLKACIVQLERLHIPCSAPVSMPQSEGNSRKQEKSETGKGKLKTITLRRGKLVAPRGNKLSCMFRNIIQLKEKHEPEKVAEGEANEMQMESAARGTDENVVIKTAVKKTVKGKPITITLKCGKLVAPSGKKLSYTFRNIIQREEKVESEKVAEGEANEMQMESAARGTDVNVVKKTAVRKTGKGKTITVTLRCGKLVAPRGKKISSMFRNIIQREENVESEKVAESEENEMQMESAATGIDENVVKKTAVRKTGKGKTITVTLRCGKLVAPRGKKISSMFRNIIQREENVESEKVAEGEANEMQMESAARGTDVNVVKKTAVRKTGKGKTITVTLRCGKLVAPRGKKISSMFRNIIQREEKVESEKVAEGEANEMQMESASRGTDVNVVRKTGKGKTITVTLRCGKLVAPRGKKLSSMFRNIIQREEKVESEKVAEGEANEMQMESAARGTDVNVVKKTAVRKTGKGKPITITLRCGKLVAPRGKKLSSMFRNIIQREENVESEKVAESEENEMQMESAATGIDENVVKKTVHETFQCMKANRVAIVLVKDEISGEEESKVCGTNPNPGNREVKKTAFSVNDTTLENVSQMHPTECLESEENVEFTKIDRPFTRSSVRNSDTQKPSQDNARQENATCKRKASDHGKNAKVKERRSNDLVNRSERLSQKIMRKTVKTSSSAVEKGNERKTETLSTPSRENVRETGVKQGKPCNISEKRERAKTKKTELKTTQKTSGSEVRGKEVKEVARGKKKPPSDVIHSCSVDCEISDSSSDSSSRGSSSRSSNSSSSKSYFSATESSSDSEGEHLATSMLEQNERFHIGQPSSV